MMGDVRLCVTWSDGRCLSPILCWGLLFVPSWDLEALRGRLVYSNRKKKAKTQITEGSKFSFSINSGRLFRIDLREKCGFEELTKEPMQGPARRYEAGRDCWAWVSGRRGRLCPGAEGGQFWQGRFRFLSSLLPLPLPLQPRSQSWDAQVLEGISGLSQNLAGVRNCWKQWRLLSYHQVFILLSHPSLLPPPPHSPIPGMVDFNLRMWLPASAATSQIFFCIYLLIFIY